VHDSPAAGSRERLTTLAALAVDVVMATGAAGTGGHFAYKAWKIAVDAP